MLKFFNILAANNRYYFNIYIILVKEHIEKYVQEIKGIKPELAIDYQNENYSSQQAQQIILASGLNKKQRQDKSRLDKISAVIILQRYLKHI